MGRVRGAIVAAALIGLVARCNGQQAIDCVPGMVPCDGICRNLVDDPANCGGCGVACSQGTVCYEGTCAPGCGGGTTQCGQSCVNFQRDRDNCGTCGAKCGSGMVCESGACSSTCGNAQTLCVLDGGAAAYCANTSTDNANCGGCGVTCGAQQVCSGGKCGSTCITGQTLCNTGDAGAYCANTQSDNANCGACGSACDPSLSCASGQCVPACGPNEGACNGICVDTTTDANNCGSCGHACGSDGVCLLGQCVCMNGKTWCGSACADVKSDANNCGSCGNVCSSGICSRGKCLIDLGAYDGILAADNGSVYRASGNVIDRFPNGGGSPTIVNTSNTPNGQIRGITLDASNLYFNDSSGLTTYVCSVPNGGGAVTTLATVSDVAWGGIAVDSNYVYLMGANALYQIPIGGGSPLTLAAGDGDVFYYPSVVTDGSNVIFAELAGVYMVPVGGGTVTTLYSGLTNSLLLTNGTLFLTGQNALLETSAAAKWKTSAVLLDGNPNAAAAGYVYAASGATIYRLDAQNFTPTPIVDVTLSFPAWMAASTTYLSWTDGYHLYQVHL